jgi:hypothetical protein
MPCTSFAAASKVSFGVQVTSRRCARFEKLIQSKIGMAQVIMKSSVDYSPVDKLAAMSMAAADELRRPRSAALAPKKKNYRTKRSLA